MPESKPLTREERDTFKRMLRPQSAGDYALGAGFSETFDAFYRALADLDRLEADNKRLRQHFKDCGDCFDCAAESGLVIMGGKDA